MNTYRLRITKPLFKSEQQRRAYEDADRTLKGIDMDGLWAKVLEEVRPKVEANERVRALSYGMASSRAVR